MTLLFTNNAQSTLASGISNSDTSIVVATGQGTLFPSPSGGNTFRATLVRASDGAIEIVDVTARSTDTLTVTRAQEGTTGLAFVTGDRIECRITAAFLNNQNVAVQTNAASSKTTPVDADELPLADSAAAYALKKLTWANLKATMAAYYDTLTATLTNKTLTTPVINGFSGTGIGSITANSASAALTVTQTGAGNAFVVEDSASTDSTPFVIDANGIVNIGVTGVISSTLVVASTAEVVRAANRADFLLKRANTSLTAPSVVANADTLGQYSFQGYDGSAYITAGFIRGEVDGTPGTNDMPGRLVFSTTADGASSPTEAMRIDSRGAVGIGGVPYAGINLLLNKSITGSATVSDQCGSVAMILSDVTGRAGGFSTYLSTQAASFTLANLRHYSAAQNTVGAGSTITNQFGFFADSSLTGATNNYGFYSNIAAGANRYNFYAAGTADNYFAGKVGIGAVPAATTSLMVSKQITGGAIAYGVYIDSPIDGGTSTTQACYFQTAASISAGSTTTLNHYATQQGTLTGTVGTQIGYNANASLTGATNNYGFYSNIAAAANRYNFYAAGTADNYFAGSVGVGGLPVAGFKFLNYGNYTGSATYFANSTQGTLQSDVTTAGVGYRSSVGTAAASFTVPNIYAFIAEQGTFGAGSTVTSQAGFTASAGLVGASNNYGFLAGNTAAVLTGKVAIGFYSAINIATGGGTTWAFYGAGTANNAFNGNSSFGKLTAPTSAVDTTSFGTNLVTNIAGTYTVLVTDGTIIQTTAASTYTLPSASSFPGRILKLVTQFAGTVVSASSNVVPIAGGAAGTAILAATAGKYAVLQSNGTNWLITEAN